MFSDWVNVEDRLPEKDGKYLVARIHGNDWSISVRKFRKELPTHWWTGWGGHWERRTAGIRYWQDLPLPPKEKEK